MTKEQSKILDIFKQLVSILEEHRLKYTAAYGTVLGAVRHKGFIPWDDDIDIFMPRKDYDIFLSLAKTINVFNIFSFETDEGYYLPFAKISDKNSTIWEDKDLPFIFGRYVDVFPLDYASGTELDILHKIKQSNKLWNHYQASIADVSFFDIFKYLFTAHKGKFLRAVKHFLYSPNKSLFKYKHFIKKYSEEDGEKCFFFNPTDSVAKVYERKWFEEVISVQFEDTTIIIPKYYDEYLTKCYGDWATPPPIEKQRPTHSNVFYCNYSELLTIEEVKQRIKRGNHSLQ